MVCGSDSANEHIGAEGRLKAGRKEDLTHVLDILHSLVCCELEISSAPSAQHKKFGIFDLMGARPASETNCLLGQNQTMDKAQYMCPFSDTQNLFLIHVPVK